jgi:patatin-like phospholipase/acyl hydrolase
VIATAQPSGIQKRLASTNEEKKHPNVHGVVVAANGAQKTASFIKKNKSSKRADRDAAGRNEQVAYGEATCDQLCPRDKSMA